MRIRPHNEAVWEYLHFLLDLVQMQALDETEMDEGDALLARMDALWPRLNPEERALVTNLRLDLDKLTDAYVPAMADLFPLLDFFGAEAVLTQIALYRARVVPTLPAARQGDEERERP